MLIFPPRKDAHYVERVLQGDDQAFRVIVDRYAGAVQGIAYAYLGNHADAEDVCQDTFLRAFQSLPTLRTVSHLGAWLITVARNRSLDLLRKRRHEDPLSEKAEQAAQTVPSLEQEEVKRIVRDQLRTLDDDSREVLVLHYLQGHKVREISTLLGISQDAVKKRLQRGREALGSKLLSRLGEDVGYGKTSKPNVERIMAAVAATPVVWKTTGAAAPVGAAATSGFPIASAVLTVAVLIVAATGIGYFARGGIASVLRGDGKLGAVIGNTVAEQTSPVGVGADKRVAAVSSGGVFGNQAATSSSPSDASKVETDRAQERREESIAQPMSPDAKGVGEIKGYVFSDDDQKIVVAGAEVMIELINWSPDQDPPKSTFKKTLSTDGQGAFSFASVPFGSYVILGYTNDGVRPHSVDLTSANPSASVTLVLKPAGALSGIVKNSKGDVIPGAVVYPASRALYNDNKPYENKRSASMRSTTNGQGQFSLPHVLKDRWRLYVFADGYAPLLSDFIEVPKSGIELILTAGSKVSGTVVDAGSGQPLPGISLSLLREGWDREHYRCTTAPDGSFQLASVRADEYMWMVDNQNLVIGPEGSTIKIAEGKDVTDLVLKAAPGGLITGRVYDADTKNGVASAAIELSFASDDDSTHLSRNADTDKEGRYTFKAIPQGKYHLNLERIEGYSPSWEKRQKSVSVSPGERVEDVDFDVRRGLAISGTVVDETGKPVAAADVTAGTRNGSGDFRTSVKQDGSFILTGFFPGDTAYVSARTGEGKTGRSGSVSLVDKDVAGITIVLGSGGVVEGQVVDKSGNPVADAGVLLSLTGGDYSSSSPSTRTNSNGGFEMRSVPVGSYRFQVADSGSSYYSFPSERPTVDVTEGQRVTGITLVIDPSGLSISGRVVDEAGKPAKNLNVQAQSEPIGSSAYGQTDENGNYILKNLTAQSYAVSVESGRYANTKREGVQAGSVNVDFVLDACARVQGVVLDAGSGLPITDFEVAATAYFQGDSSTNLTYTRYRDAQGRFELEYVQPGDVRTTIVVRATGYGWTTQEITGLQPGQTTSGVSISLQPSGTVSGMVLSSAGQPVSGALIFEQNLPREWQRQRAARAITGADGVFSVEGVAKETSMLVAWHSEQGKGTTAISPGSTAAQSIRIRLDQGGVLQGYVTVNGQPIQSANVNFSYNSDSSVPRDEMYRTTTTQADGSYRFTGLAPEKATMHVTLQSGSGGSTRQLVREIVVQGTPGQREDFDFPSTNAVLDVVVRVNGVPTERARVIVHNKDAGQVATQVTDAQGYCRLSALPSGQVQVNVSVEDPQAPNSGQGRALMHTVTLVDNSVTREEFDLNGSAVISGVVTRPQGAGQSTTFVIVSRGSTTFSATDLFGGTLPTDIVARAIVGPDGSYRANNLEAGVHTITAMNVPSNLSSRDAIVANTKVASSTVTVSAGEQVTVDLMLQ